ncbi:DNA polymerase III subunit delta' [bacterium]|nr:DNA polymerase III subunit delta' [bacterium]
MQLDPQDFGPVYGHVDAKLAMSAALADGRLHHGWMLLGPRGIGKSKLAIRFAAQLLTGASAPDFELREDEGVGRLLAAGSHPDFRLLRRPIDDAGKQKTEIPVAHARDLISFFALKPGMSGRRVAIVDAMDELNRYGMNALLKTLEEPPDGAVLILVSHGEQGLPPTIRSRCRLVMLRELSEADHRLALEAAGLEGAALEAACAGRNRRPGQSLRLAGESVGAARKAALAAIRSASDRSAGRDEADLIRIAGQSEDALAAAFDALRSGVEDQARSTGDPVQAGDAAARWLSLVRIEAEARELNMDRSQTIATAWRRFTAMARPATDADGRTPK